MLQDLHYLEIHELSKLIQQGEISPVEVTQAQLERIDQLDNQLHSYARVTPEHALAQAKQAEQELLQGIERSPLQGIPVAIKDLIDTQGIVTAGGMPLHHQRIPQHDATVVTKLRDAGSVLLGKLQMTEGAFAIHHPDLEAPINPWGEEHWAGASSSGAGVATAAGLCYGALGSDTGGSIRFPCAANGLTGLKPTWGRVSRYGVMEMAASLDHIGPMTRSAQDTLLMFQAIAGHDPRDHTSLSIAPLQIKQGTPHLQGITIGIDEHWMYDGIDPVIQVALAQMMDVIVAQGGQIKPIRMPNTVEVSQHWEAHCGVQTAIAHEATYPQYASAYGPALSRLIEGGRQLNGLDYQRILLEAMRFDGQMNALFKHVDLILAPVQPYAAPTHQQLANLAQDPEANRRLIQFTAPFNVSGHPCISFPISLTEQGLPIGGQLIGAKLSEVTLCEAVIAIQEATHWHQHHCLKQQKSVQQLQPT